MRSPSLLIDQLIHAAREVESIHPWVDDTLGADLISERYSSQLDALADAVRVLRGAAVVWTCYSDGRPVQIGTDIEPGRRFVYIVRAVPEHRGERLLCSGTLAPHGPGERHRGRYDVYVDDWAATIRVEHTAALALVEAHC